MRTGDINAQRSLAIEFSSELFFFLLLVSRVTNGSSLPVVRPATSLTEKEESKYNSLILKASKMEKKLLKSLAVSEALSSDYDAIVVALRGAAALYIRAIELCDGDMALHRKLHYYQQIDAL